MGSLYAGVGEYTWTQVAPASAISTVMTSLESVEGAYIGQRYRVADSNRMIKDILDASGIALSPDQIWVLGRAPGLTSWFFR